MRIKIGDTIFESGKGQNICIMLTEAEHKQIKDMPPKLGPRYYGIYEADNARANFEADQKALEAEYDLPHTTD